MATGRDRAWLRCVGQYGNLALGSAGSAQKWNSSLPTAPIGHRHWKGVSCVTAGPTPSRPLSSGADGGVSAMVSPVVRDSMLFIVSVPAVKCLLLFLLAPKLTDLRVKLARWGSVETAPQSVSSTPTTLEAESCLEPRASAGGGPATTCSGWFAGGLQPRLS